MSAWNGHSGVSGKWVERGFTDSWPQCYQKALHCSVVVEVAMLCSKPLLYMVSGGYKLRQLELSALYCHRSLAIHLENGLLPAIMWETK